MDGLLYIAPKIKCSNTPAFWCTGTAVTGTIVWRRYRSFGGRHQPRQKHCRRPLSLVAVMLGFWLSLAGSVLALDPARTLKQYVHRTYTMKDGLPSDDIQAITQTRDGYLWVGTEDGLARFDGSKFAVFNKASGQLPGNFIYCLFQDSQGLLWVGTNGGLAVYEAGRFRTVNIDPASTNNVVHGVAEDREGALWISANYKLYRYREGHFGCWDPAAQDAGLGGVVDITVDKTGAVWLVLKGGVVCRFHDSRFEPVPEFAALKGQALERISTDIEGSVWISNFSGGAYCYQNGHITAFGSQQGLPEAVISRIVRDRDGIVWLGTDLGLARIFGGECTSYQLTGIGEAVSSVCEDWERNLWVGSLGGEGLYQFIDGSFTTFDFESGLPEGPTKAVWESSDGRLWLANSGGIYCQTAGRFVEILSAKDRFGGDFSLVEFLANQRDNSLWIGTARGLYHYDDGKLTRYTVSEGLPSNAVYSLWLDRDGILWIGTDAGVVCLKDGRTVSPEVCQVATKGQVIRGIVEDHEGGIWLGASSGPIRFKDGQIKQFGYQDGLAGLAADQLCVSSDGVVWIATLNGGLSRYCGNRFFTYTEKDGLPSDQIFAIIDDPFGDLWLGSEKGIFRISQKQLDDFRAGRIKRLLGTTFGVSDGLRSASINETGRPNVTRTRDGRLWWCIGQGISMVDPAKLTLHDVPGPIVIENVRADDRPLPIGDPALPPGVRRLEIEYGSLTYAAPDKIQFRYRLDGIDRDWFNSGQHRDAIFTSLRGGNYRFRVQASADGGATWSEPGAELALDVLPHFYETWWFGLSCVAVTAGLVWLAFALRRRRLEARFREVIAERVRVAGEIHDSVAQGFASAAMFLDSLERAIPADSTIHGRLKSIRYILGTSLADTRAMIATLRGQPFDNEDLELALRKLVERLTPISSAPITLEFGQQEVLSASVTVQQELMRICQEGINNAIRHADAGHIWVTLGIVDGQSLRLTVRDDGRGFDVGRTSDSVERKHFGLTGLAERARRIGATLNIRSQPGYGTQLEVVVPFVK